MMSQAGPETRDTASANSNEPPSCHGGLENLDEEHSYWIDEVEGDVPTDLQGTFFRNGPGRQRIGTTAYGHWFDGDGMLCAFTFRDGRVHFKNRYVRTPKYLEETESQTIRYRGFGTQIPGGLLSNFLRLPANPANTSLIYHGGHLLALNEGGRPWKLDPATLETVGEFTYGGALNRGNVFSAHGKVHQASGDYINFGAGMSGLGLKGPKPCLNIYRVDPAGRLFAKGQIALSTFPFCHDFALTDRYAIFFVGSIVFDGMGGVMLGRRSISDVVTFDPNISMAVVVVDLETFTEVKRFETDPGAIIHFGNAFEQGDELVVDGMFAGDFEANGTLSDVFNPAGRFGGGTYMRYKLNMTTGALDAEQVTDYESEFPTFNPAKTGQRQDYTYTACSIDNGANSFFNAIQKIDFDGNSQLVTLPLGHYGSEPIFAPSASASSNELAEDDGYVLEVVYDGYAHKSELQVYDARNLDDRVCSLKLKHHLPHQFHGHFSGETFGDTQA
jgi:all-trans-8'-apo-beta-carotenal 15,15'-oxygenase